MENAEQASKEIIHYLPQYIDFLGAHVHMQTMYMSWLTCIICIVVLVGIGSRAKVIPGRAQCMLEMLVQWLCGLMEGNMGKEGRRVFASFLLTLFFYIFVANEVGLLPQVGGHLIHFTSPTNDINAVFGLAILVMVVNFLVGIYRNGLGFFSHFVKPFPLMLPLNIVEELAKPVTMSLRLFGNILAGEILLIVLYQLAPWLPPIAWIFFSLCVGFLQAFIFTMLAIVGFAPIFRHDH